MLPQKARSVLKNTTSLRHRTHGSTIVDFGIMVGLISVVAVGAVYTTGVEVNCIFERAAYTLGADIEPGGCGGSLIATGPTTSGPATPAPSPYTLAFDDTSIDASERSNTSITIDGLAAGDTIDLLISQGSTTLALSATAAGATYQFASINLSSFSRGEVEAVATVTPTVGPAEDSAPGTANLVLPLMLESDVPTNGMGFGKEIAMTGSRIFVGAPLEGDGVVYAFDRSNGDLLFKIPADPVKDGYEFGSIMAVGGGHLAITSQQQPEGNDFVSVYDLDGNFLYDVDEDPAAPNDNYFGREIQISGTTLLVGDQLHTFGIGHMGGIHAFDLSNAGAFMWSATNPSTPGSGTRFDTDGTTLIATSWNMDGATTYNMSDGSLIQTVNLAGDSQREHIEIVNGKFVYGDNPFDMRMYNLDPVGYEGTMSTPLSRGVANIYEEAGNLLLTNNGNANQVSVIDITTRTVLDTIDFPDTMPSLMPNFGEGLSYEGGEVAIGAPAHQPAYDGNRSGAVYLLPMP
jgi:Flp pilus assembly pilin Flp